MSWLGRKKERRRADREWMELAFERFVVAMRESGYEFADRLVMFEHPFDRFTLMFEHHWTENEKREEFALPDQEPWPSAVSGALFLSAIEARAALILATEILAEQTRRRSRSAQADRDQTS